MIEPCDPAAEKELISRMMDTFGDDDQRIRHALRVLEIARRIHAVEGGTERVVVGAAILHDIGIVEAERKHGSSAPKWQELEGPPIAAAILEELHWPAEERTHICRIVGSHHSGRDIDTREFCIIWDADWVVNLVEEDTARKNPQLHRKRLETVFRTGMGRKIAGSRITGV